ncbi:MAG: hypothetical protein NC131_14525 [Roseburia sp.]|nr:hypothetical protein [Roseburia sp.]
MDYHEGAELDRHEPSEQMPQQTAAEKPTTEGPSIDFAPETPDEPASTSAKAAPQPRRHHRARHMLIIIILIALIVGGLAFYLTFISPYATDSRVSGYVTNIEKRGFVFKTFEGEMVTESALADTSHIYNLPLAFSVKSDSIASILQSYQGTGRPLTVVIERYNATLPWRGSSKNVVVGVVR